MSNQTKLFRIRVTQHFEIECQTEIVVEATDQEDAQRAVRDGEYDIPSYSDKTWTEVERRLTDETSEVLGEVSKD